MWDLFIHMIKIWSSSLSKLQNRYLTQQKELSLDFAQFQNKSTAFQQWEFFLAQHPLNTSIKKSTICVEIKFNRKIGSCRNRNKYWQQQIERNFYHRTDQKLLINHYYLNLIFYQPVPNDVTLHIKILWNANKIWHRMS